MVNFMQINSMEMGSICPRRKITCLRDNFKIIKSQKES